MLLFQRNLLILFILSSSFISINCLLNDTEITTIDSLIDNEGSSIDADEPSEHSNTEIKDQSSSLPPSSSSTAAKNPDETRTQPTPTDDIKDEENNSAAAAANKAENNNESNDDSLFSISPGASSSSPLDKTGNEDKLVSNNDNEANENDEDNENDSPASSSTESSKKAETDSKAPTSKVDYEECVALGNENCGTPPEDSETSEESNLPKLNTNVDNSKPKQPNETSINNQINSDESKSNEAQEQKTKHFWYEDVPLKLGLPFVLVLFVLFVIIFLLFLVFLIQDSFSRKNENSQNNETVKIKTGYGTQKFNLNQLQMLEKRMRAARDEVDLHEVNVQSFNNKKDDSDDQNNNVPNENAFENIALQDKQNSSRM